MGRRKKISKMPIFDRQGKKIPDISVEFKNRVETLSKHERFLFIVKQ